MEGTFFSVDEAASILGFNRSTIYRLLEEGWLKGPGGRPKYGKRGQVSKKSLFQFVLIDRVDVCLEGF
jgi:excisionase family DNA binding protein